MVAQLAEHGIYTALDLSQISTSQARSKWGVVLERTVRELQGTSCLSLEHAPAPKQQIACTRSFGHTVTTLPPLIEAVSEFATRAAEKLRHSQQLCSALLVFVHTSPFRSGPKFHQSITIPLHHPSSDTRALIHAAVKGLRHIYQPGFELAKAGVMLLDLCPASTQQQADLLFDAPNPSRNRNQLMHVIDTLNHRYGQATVHMGCTSPATLPTRADGTDWRMKQERRSPRYTTRLHELPIALA